MTTARPGRVRKVLVVIHRWIGVSLAAVLVPIAVSGAILVWNDELDAVLNPARYRISGVDTKLAPSEYLARAAAELGPDFQVTAIRYPESAGWPVRAMARGTSARGDGPPRIMTAYLDPPTGKVLDVVDFRASLMGFLHVFHENLTIPQFSGRQIVGWAGVGMLVLSLTGICIWWPRTGAFLPGLRWRRTPETTTNLHHLLGFWISFPLAIVSLTGIYLSFPPQARSLMGTIAPMNPQPQRGGFAGPVAAHTALTADAALAAAQAAHGPSMPVALFLPTAPRERSAAAPLIWRIQLRKSESDDLVTWTVDDRTGAAARGPEPLAGDRAAQWIRWIHEGSHSGVLWQMVVFLTGVFPAVFAVTGLIMWWRGLRTRRAVAALRNSPQDRLQAAE